MKEFSRQPRKHENPLRPEIQSAVELLYDPERFLFWLGQHGIAGAEDVSASLLATGVGRGVKARLLGPYGANELRQNILETLQELAALFEGPAASFEPPGSKAIEIQITSSSGLQVPLLRVAARHIPRSSY